VQISISVTGRGNVKAMVFFNKVKDANSSRTTPWSAGQSMQPSGARKYVITLSGETLDSKSGFSQSQVSYQFVAQLANGDQVRSQVFNDLTLQVCLVMPG